MMAAWGSAVILIGGVLTSYHQPFQTPAEGILALAPHTNRHGWRAIHILSGSCACSQRVMRHILARSPFDEMEEEILMIDGQEYYRPESSGLLESLDRKGFPVTHVSAKDISPDIGLRGVPLLIFAAPNGKIVYMGGYGTAGDQDSAILRQVRSGRATRPLAVLGCAIGSRTRRDADPFRLKYREGAFHDN
jgi:hypothetical protein